MKPQVQTKEQIAAEILAVEQEVIRSMSVAAILAVVPMGDRRLAVAGLLNAAGSVAAAITKDDQDSANQMASYLGDSVTKNFRAGLTIRVNLEQAGLI